MIVTLEVVDGPERGFHAPEASGGEGCFLCFSHNASSKDQGKYEDCGVFHVVDFHCIIGPFPRKSVQRTPCPSSKSLPSYRIWRFGSCGRPSRCGWKVYHRSNPINRRQEPPAPFRLHRAVLDCPARFGCRNSRSGHRRGRSKIY
jgi:hypothetical protein